jgi:hypothetical protein
MKQVQQSMLQSYLTSAYSFLLYVIQTCARVKQPHRHHYQRFLFLILGREVYCINDIKFYISLYLQRTDNTTINDGPQNTFHIKH